MNCDHDLVAPILDQSAGQKFFFRDMATSRPSRKTRRAPTSTRTRASILGGGSVPWLPNSRMRSRAGRVCSTCRLRVVGRESRPITCQPSGFRCRRAHHEAPQLQPPGIMRKSVHDARHASAVLGQRRNWRAPALAASPQTQG